MISPWPVEAAWSREAEMRATRLWTEKGIGVRGGERFHSCVVVVVSRPVAAWCHMTKAIKRGGSSICSICDKGALNCHELSCLLTLARASVLKLTEEGHVSELFGRKIRKIHGPRGLDRAAKLASEVGRVR